MIARYWMPMTRRLALILAALSALFLAPMTVAAAPPAPAPRLETAVFAGGCFWCMEHDMKGIRGVVAVESGYTGGHVDHPRYEDVTSETSGHYESVRVSFDPAKVDYGFILSRYWKLVDPTDDGGQFCDRGPSYRTAIFVANDAQRKAAEQSKVEAARDLKRGKILTPILPLKAFWPAEEYHRDFAVRNKGHYDAYRSGCGRDERLKQVWGG
jgi:peptide-methionine (S)-S-oxide reductase